MNKNRNNSSLVIVLIASIILALGWAGAGTAKAQNILPNCFEGIDGNFLEENLVVNTRCKDPGCLENEEGYSVNINFPNIYNASLSRSYGYGLDGGNSEKVVSLMVRMRISDGAFVTSDEVARTSVKDYDFVRALMFGFTKLGLEGIIVTQRPLLFSNEDPITFKSTGQEFGLHEIYHTNDGEVVQDKKDYFYGGRDKLKISDYLSCSREDLVSNPTCNHWFVYQGNIMMTLSYNRKFLSDWRHVRLVVERFMDCSLGKVR